MISISRLGLSAALLGGALANAQTISGPGTFPQFRDMNGLSGNGFAVMRDGELSLNGALTLSTPIAYLPRPGKTIIGVSSRSHDLRPRFPETRGFGGNSPSDGTAQILTGWDWGNVRFLGTHQIVSSAGDNVNNLQMMYRDPDRRFGDWTFSFGIHNILNRPSAAGDSFPDDDDQMSLSYFFVGTKECSREAYFSFGLGDIRYKGLFGSYSALLNDSIRGYVEYDRFNWNYGVATESSILGKQLFIQMGVVRGNYLTWSLNMVF